MAAVELKLKSTSVPLFQRGNFLGTGFNPSLKKRGRGDFLSRMNGELWGGFLGQDTSLKMQILFRELKFAAQRAEKRDLSAS
jgi:hypothetical protein